ncbi:hypothetical protein GCM10009000_082090 [Halobacterium noricense]|uniref:ABC transporter substrate-binding protein n=1 Tax=Haladaptatus pallidirubidus TaxID=1008152 RepID=A0AAV3UQ45_9EURY
MAGISGIAGCLNNGSSGSGNGTPTIRYAGISGAELNDLMAMFHQSDHIPGNVMEHVGDKYEFKFVDVQSTPVVVNTLGSDEADAGLLAYSSLANAIQGNTIESGVSILAPLTYDGPRYADTFNSTVDSDITEVGDIANGAFGVNGVGSAIDIAARVILTRNGVDLNTVEFRELSFGAMPTTLSEGRVDVGSFIQPFYEMNKNDLQTVFDTTDAFDSFLKIFMTVRNDFLESNSNAIEYWLEDFWTGMQWWKDDGNSEKRLDIAEEVVDLPRDILKQLVQTDMGYYHGEDGLDIDAEWLQRPVDGMHEIGFLDSKIDVSKHIDTSYLPDEAATKPSIN